MSAPRERPKWIPGTFRTEHRYGLQVDRVGWISGHFGVDERWWSNPHPWSVTHLPTGYLVCHASSRRYAQLIANRLARLGDWSTADPSKIPDGTSAIVREYVDRGVAFRDKFRDETIGGDE